MTTLKMAIPSIKPCHSGLGLDRLCNRILCTSTLGQPAILRHWQRKETLASEASMLLKLQKCSGSTTLT